MTTDLASRVRRLVDGGATPISLEEVAHRRPPNRSSNTRYAILAAALVLVVVSTVAVIAAVDTGTPTGVPAGAASSTVTLSQIPQGVSVQQFGQRLAFVVRDGAHVTVFDTNVQHLQGENGLWWCPNEQLFVAPTHAETFARSGKAIGGPARAGLDRFRSAVRHDRLIVDPSHLIPGAKGNAQTAAGQRGEPGSGPWDSGPASFCAGALKANNAPAPHVLDVNAVAGGYEQKIYDVPEGLTEIRFGGYAGIVFMFDDPRYGYCLLAADKHARHSCRVSLTPGDYLVGSIPGHRQAGYEATIHVTAATAPPETPSTTTPHTDQPTTP